MECIAMSITHTFLRDEYTIHVDMTNILIYSNF